MENKLSKFSPQEQKVLLTKFKERIADVWPTLSNYQKDDRWLCRWLRSKDVECVRAESMFRKSLKWRKDEKIDQLLTWQAPKEIVDTFLIEGPGFDHNNATICVAQFGRWNVRKAIAMGLGPDLHKFIFQVVEMGLKIQECRSNKEQFLTTFALVLDFDQFSIKQIISKETVEFLIELLKTFEANYPETLSNCWVINAPKIFQLLLKIVKPFIRGTTLSRVHIHGSNIQEWRADMLTRVEPQFLPSWLGGSNTSVLNYKASETRLDMYKLTPPQEIFPESELDKIVLQSGDQHLVHIDLSSWQPSNSDTRLSWNFRTEEHDLDFALLYSPPGTDLETMDECEEVATLFSCGNCDAHLHTQHGIHVVDKPGIYTLVLDNSAGTQERIVLYGFATRSQEEILKRQPIFYYDKVNYPKDLFSTENLIN